MINITYHGGIGDALMLSCVSKELSKRGQDVGVITKHLELFLNSSDIKALAYPGSRMDHHLRKIKRPIHPNYLINYRGDLDTRDPLKEHVLVHMCKACAIEGVIELRPWIYLNEEEKQKQIEGEYICIQSSCMGAAGPSPLKIWGAQKFRRVKNMFEQKVKTVQIGSTTDPKIDCDIDLRGRTDIRQIAGILFHARLFLGLEGGLMHIARAVDCPSVIIYGGRLKPWQIGYIGNINVTSGCPNKIYNNRGCWRTLTCDYYMQCMKEIGVERVIEGVETLLGRSRNYLPVERRTI